MAQVAELFADGRQRRADQGTDEQELYKQIGRLKMEVEWLKKKLPRSAEVKRLCIEPKHKHLSIARQCQLVGLARSSWYYEPLGESADNLGLMREIDRLSIKLPFFGTRKVRKRFGINRKRAQRLMRLLGLEAVCLKRSCPAARPLATRFTPIHCEIWRLRSPIRSGQATSPPSLCSMASST
jgi:putative transposase